MFTIVLPTGQLHGWGVCGKWLAREMAQITPTQLMTDVTVLEHAGAAHEVEILRRLAVSIPDGAVQLGGPVLMGMDGIDLRPVWPNVRGTPTVGYCFFETDVMKPEWIEAARGNFDLILTGSNWCTEVLRAHGLTKADTLLQGVDTASFNTKSTVEPWKPGAFVIFSGGKFEFRKGQDLVIRAAEIMQQRHPDVFLVTAWFNQFPSSFQSMTASSYMKHVSAEGDYRQVVLKLMEANGLDPARVVILGATPNAQLPSVYHQTDIGVFPNRCEGGTNLVLMEYMARGKPVIASWSSGHRDILTRRNSLILPPRNTVPIPVTPELTATWDECSIDELVEKLEWAYQNRDAIKNIGATAGHDLAQRPWSRMARELLGFISATT